MSELRHIAEVLKDVEPLTVNLYVCEECRANGITTVGKLPADRGGTYRGMCSGPPGFDHKKKAMKLRPFREVVG